jgi:hypothetical protein
LILFSLYQRFHLDEGFQGCIHELSINERRVTFNSSEHHTILSAQNIGQSYVLFEQVACLIDISLVHLAECFANPCRSGIASCRNSTRCIPIRNNDANSYKCLCNDYSSISSSMSKTDCSVLSMDHCSLKPCNDDQQCIHVYPNNYTCICLNCSLSTYKTIIVTLTVRLLRRTYDDLIVSIFICRRSFYCGLSFEQLH